MLTIVYKSEHPLTSLAAFLRLTSFLSICELNLLIIVMITIKKGRVQMKEQTAQPVVKSISSFVMHNKPAGQTRTNMTIPHAKIVKRILLQSFPSAGFMFSLRLSSSSVTAVRGITSHFLSIFQLIVGLVQNFKTSSVFYP